uniref:uncharacterized protein isoform X2 n=1 Tax=Myxine glutinosa TaxID=7769 RepID=UPI00358E512B
MAVKPFKVSVLNEPSHGLVASSLKELTHLGCKKLHVTEKKQVQVVLAEDGTLVDDEEYFSFLEPNTALVFLMPNQTWQPSCSRTGPKTAEMTEVDTGAGEEPEWLGPAQRLSMYPANILLLSDIQLQAVLETKLSDLACVVNDNKQAEALQDGCQQLLDDRDRRRETLQLLQLMRDQNGKRIRHSYIPYRKTSCICNAGWFCPEEDIDRCEQCTPHTTCPVGKGVKQKETPKNEDQMDSCLVPHSNMDTSLEARLCMPQPHVGLSTEELQERKRNSPFSLAIHKLLLLMLLLLCVNPAICSAPNIQTSSTSSGSRKCVLQAYGDCPPGCFLENMLSCGACIPNKTYTEYLNKLPKCIMCPTCDSENGKRIRHPCRPYRKTSCICNAGWFCPEEDIDRCEQCTPHTTCPVGKGVKQKGTSLKDTTCEICPENFFSNVTSAADTCVRHTSCEDLGLSTMENGTRETNSHCGQASRSSGNDTDPTDPPIMTEQNMSGVTIVWLSPIFLISAIVFAVPLLIFYVYKRNYRAHAKPTTPLCKEVPSTNSASNDGTSPQDTTCAPSSYIYNIKYTNINIRKASKCQVGDNNQLHTADSDMKLLSDSDSNTSLSESNLDC